jgi:hypothetical protein
MSILIRCGERFEYERIRLAESKKKEELEEEERSNLRHGERSELFSCHAAN